MPATASRTRLAHLSVSQVNRDNPKPVDLAISEAECMEGLVALKRFEITPGEPVVIQFLGHTLTFDLQPAE